MKDTPLLLIAGGLGLLAWFTGRSGSGGGGVSSNSRAPGQTLGGLNPSTGPTRPTAPGSPRPGSATGLTGATGELAINGVKLLGGIASLFKSKPPKEGPQNKPYGYDANNPELNPGAGGENPSPQYQPTPADVFDIENSEALSKGYDYNPGAPGYVPNVGAEYSTDVSGGSGQLGGGYGDYGGDFGGGFAAFA